MSNFELIATCAFGLEAVISKELKRLSYFEQKIENGRVIFLGDEKAIVKANLWLRSAERVFIKVGEFEAVTFDDLFEKTKMLPWADYLPETACFPVDGKSIKSKLFSVSDCQAIVKKAIVEKMKIKYKKQWFDETGPRYKIEVGILKDIATITIDTSGIGLHKRGYRKLSVEAPIKETLAAALIQLSRWHPDRPFIDPLCGSGTIPIEAALIGRNIAPGLKRNFDAEQWSLIPHSLWANAREEALQIIDRTKELYIMGTDISSEALSLARYHEKEASVENTIHFQQISMKDLRSSKKFGFIICNPPYGERLGEKSEVESLYKEMGGVFSNMDNWSYCILTSHPNFERLFGKRADKKRKLYNGRIQCNYYYYLGAKPPWLQKNKKEIND